MLFNKIQTKEDVGDFLDEVSGDTVRKILKDSPDHIVDLIADIYLAFQLKANIPPDEAEANAGKIREKKVAELFENATFGNLYAESQKIKKRLAEQGKQLAEQGKRLAEADRSREKGIMLYVELLQETGMSYEKACHVLQDKYELPEDEAKEKLEKYWR